MNTLMEGVQTAARASVPLLSWRAAASLVAILAAGTALSQFFRASTAVIAPELIDELTLSPEMLAFANASFFMALLIAQVPVGMALDRFGARTTITVLALPMAAGAMLHALVTSGTELAAVRFLVGLGCSGSFAAGVVLITRWFPRPAWSTMLSWHFALSQVGLLLAGTPLAAAAGLFGWRLTFVLAGVLALLIAALFFLLVRDKPLGPVADAPAEAASGLRGLRQVLSMPDLPQVLCLFMATFAALVAVQVLWAGPYLHDIHHLDPVARGNVLLGMALVQTAGVLAVGPLDRLFNTRKWVVAGLAALAVAALAGLAWGPASLEVNVLLLLLFSASATYGSMLYAHVRSLFPDHLAGRSATVANLAPLIGASIVPTLTGFIPPLFASTGGGYAPAAYQCIFAVLALLLLAGLAVYLTVKESKPSLDAGTAVG